MRHVVGKSFLDRVEVGRTAERGPVKSVRVHVVVWIIVGLQSHVPLDVFWLNEKQFGATEVTGVNTIRSRAPVEEFHEVGKMWMIVVLEICLLFTNNFVPQERYRR